MEPVFDVLIFETADGRAPFYEWLMGIRDRSTKARVETHIDRLALGNFSNCAPVGEGVSELKINFGPGYRVYFGQDGRNLIILLIGGKKDTQSADVKLATAYWREYNA